MNNEDLHHYMKSVIFMPMSYVNHFKDKAEFGFVVTHHTREAMDYLKDAGLSDVQADGRRIAMAIDISPFLKTDEQVLLVLFKWGFEKEASKFRLRFL